MKRIDALNEIIGSSVAGDALIVSNIGYCSREVYSVSDRPNHFYMLGSMGLASSIGIGLALAQREKDVIVLDGDGSILMNLGTLATIGDSAPANYHLVIIDNHVHDSTGGQTTDTARNADLLSIARGAGVSDCIEVKNQVALRRLLKRERLPRIIVVECEAGNAEVPLVPLSSVDIKKRFITAVMSRQR